VKLGLLADVHANLPALRAVLAALDAEGVRVVLCAGDLVGYGPHPGEVLDLLRERNVGSVGGNHDRAAAAADARGFNPWAAEAVEWTRGRLSPADLGYLKALPESLRHGDVAVYHGHPSDPDRYVFPGEMAAACMDLVRLASARAVVLGHTHVPAIATAGRGMAVNPGAVGQPRDGDPRAACAMLDTNAAEARLCRVQYPVAAVQRDMEAAGLPSPLVRRLATGV